jgi:cyclophilin family peptidyl-prolyl cis-trans isomerase/HEAT repeat protein
MRAEASLLALLALLACAPPPATAPAAEPVLPPRPRPAAIILDEAEIAAVAELLRMEDRRVIDSVRIGGLLHHPNAAVRRRAALAAGRIGDRRTTALLIGALGDSTASVRTAAAFALGELADTSRAVIDALSAAALDTQHDSVAVEAAGALGRLGAEGGRRTLLRLLAQADSAATAPDTVPAPRDSAAGAKVVQEALLAIWRLPRTETAVAAVTPHLASADPETRWRAAYALTRLASPGTVAHMRALLEDDDPLVRSLAARALRAPTVDSAGARADVVPVLLAALSDPHAHVRINAAGALGTYADSALAEPLIGMLGAENRNVAAAAVQALAQTRAGAAAAALVRLTEDPQAPIGLRGPALASLVRLDAAVGVRAAQSYVLGEDWLARLYAARALAGAPWSLSEAPLRHLAADDDPRVAAAALGSIANAADSTASLRPLYVEALGTADEGVRAAAVAGLGRRASAADLDILLQAYDRAQRDDTNEAALAAVTALAGLARRNVPVARNFFLRFQRSNDAVVRLRVAQAFGSEGWGDPLPAEAGRPLEFYLGVVRDLVAPELAGVARPRALILTPAGGITLELFGADAPLTVRNFMTLASGGHFRAAPAPGSPTFRWHRVVPNFVLQDGDTRGDGSGGPGYAIRDEINGHRYLRGTLGMALSGPDTGGSQFFITHSPQPHLDGGYTVFGRVVAGMEAADRVLQDDPILSIEVYR